MSKLGWSAFLIACFLTLTASPNYAFSPSKENIDSLVIISENTLSSASARHISSKPAVLGVYLSEDGLYPIVDQYGWNSALMWQIMLCESGGNPNAYNPEWHKGCRGSYGIFQVACVHSKYVDSLEDL